MGEPEIGAEGTGFVAAAGDVKSLPELGGATERGGLGTMDRGGTKKGDLHTPYGTPVGIFNVEVNAGAVAKGGLDRSNAAGKARLSVKGDGAVDALRVLLEEHLHRCGDLGCAQGYSGDEKER